MIGKTISHYKILEKLGEGGMGVVYKAEDTKLKRTVALKFLPPELTRDPEAKKRFIQEAQAASSLDHNNICTVHEIDETKDGQMFIAMACYEGESLKQKIERGPLKIEEAVDLAIQIAQGLDKAHEKKIIHRDLKPANVLVTEDGVVKIVDFGLAKLAGQTMLTQEGTTLGTVSYMSPEQAEGQNVDHRTDLWALGVVLYEMLTGKLPFGNEYAATVIYSIVNEDPEPITGLRTGVPMELERIVNKCLQKDSSARYQHADELLVDLRALQEAEKSAISKVQPQSLAKIPTLRKVAVPAILIFIAIISVAGYFFLFSEAESKERIPIAVADFVNQTDEQELNGLSGMLITAMEKSRRLSVFSRSRMFDILKQMGRGDVSTINETQARDICRQANINALVVTAIRKFGKLYSIDLKILDPQAGDYIFAEKEDGEGQESIPAMIDRLAEKTRKGLKEKEDEIIATSQNVADVTTPNLEAYQHYFRGQELIDRLQWGQAAEEFRKAIALDSTFGLAYYRLSYAIGWNPAAVTFAQEPLQRALKLIVRIPERERYLVRAASTSGYADQIAILEEMEKLYPDDKEMNYRIADYAFHSGDLTTSLKYHKKLLKMDPTHKRTLYHLADVYTMVSGPDGDYEVILARLNDVSESLPQVYEIKSNLADIYTITEQYDKAEKALKVLIADNQPREARFFGYRMLAYFYPYVGKYRDSLRAFDRVIELAWFESDTALVAELHVEKARRIRWGWYDGELAWRQIEKMFPFHDHIDPSARYWGLRIFVRVAKGDYSVAERAAIETGSTWWRQMVQSRIQSARDECDQSQALADSASQEHNKFSTIMLNYPLAECQFRKGQLVKAENNSTALRDFNMNHLGYRAIFYPKSFYVLGKIYEKMGDNQRAIVSYEKFLDLWKDADEDLPDLIDANARLAKLTP